MSDVTPNPSVVTTRRMPTIRSRLVFLVGASVIPAALMAMVLVSYSYDRERARLVRESVAAARTMIQAVDREFASIRLAAEVLATSPHLQSGDTAAFYDQAQDVVRRQVGHNVVLSDATGQQLVNTIAPLGKPLPRHGNPAQLRTVFETGRPVVSDIYVGGVLRRPVMSIDVPVLRGGKVVYDLSVGILPDRFAAILSDQHLPPGWIAVVFDSAGTIAARTHDMERFVGKKGAPALVKRMAEVTEGSLEMTALDGIPVVFVFSRIPAFNWTVAMGIPTSRLTGELGQSLRWFVIGMVILILGSIAVAWVIGGRISRSIRGLTEPALALGEGAAVTVPSLHLKEADEVGKAMMKASRILREVQHRAEHDALTGLVNRAAFAEIVDRQLAVCRRSGSALAVLYIDLDRFKAVNDAHGHATGDELLRAVALRIASAIRATDVAGRLGGDEFAVLLIDAGAEAASRLAEKLTDSVSAPYSIGASTFEVTASIGVAVYPGAGNSGEALLQSADKAMYEAKAARERVADAAPQP